MQLLLILLLICFQLYEDNHVYHTRTLSPCQNSYTLQELQNAVFPDSFLPTRRVTLSSINSLLCKKTLIFIYGNLY